METMGSVTKYRIYASTYQQIYTTFREFSTKIVPVDIRWYGFSRVRVLKKHFSGVYSRTFYIWKYGETRNKNYTIHKGKGSVNRYLTESKNYYKPRKYRHVSYDEPFCYTKPNEYKEASC